MCGFGSELSAKALFYGESLIEGENRRVRDYGASFVVQYCGSVPLGEVEHCL